MDLVDDEQAELVAVLVDVAIRRVIGCYCDVGDVVAAAAKYANLVGSWSPKALVRVACHWFSRSIVGTTTRVLTEASAMA